MKFRGNEYGLKQTQYSDERLDPEKATRAAAHHLHDLYNEFGDWYLAIAAYNCGPGAIERAVERTGYADFWELRARRALPTETTNYVPIILAMTIMAKNAPEYGLDQITPDAPVEYDTIVTSFPHQSRAHQRSQRRPDFGAGLQLNPALLRSIAPGNFEIRVPKGTGAQVEAGLDLVPTELRVSSRMHRVEAGQNLASIARQYKASAMQIAMANNLKGGEPSEGDRLLVPAAYREVIPALRHAAAFQRLAPPSGLLRASLGSGQDAGHKAFDRAAQAKRPVHPAAGTLAQLKDEQSLPEPLRSPAPREYPPLRFLCTVARF